MYRTIVRTLDRPELPENLSAFGEITAFETLCDQTPVLQRIESDFTGLAVASNTLKVGTWNLERCKCLPETVTRLQQLDLDILFLSEMDDGMARSGNVNTTRLLAEALGMTYAFGVEFIESGHGTQSERVLFANQQNVKSLHGNAILSRFALSRLDMLRLPGGEVWTSMDWHDGRLGSRIALGGVIMTASGPLALISVHQESLPGPDERAGHMRRILDFIDASFSGMPVLLGGDLNSADLPEAHDHDETTPAWFLEPEAFEPLFANVRTAGFRWTEANTAQHTRRQIANGRPYRPFKKVDWLFTRCVAAHSPMVHPAVDAAGSPISDHELVVATIQMPG